MAGARRLTLVLLVGALCCVCFAAEMSSSMSEDSDIEYDTPPPRRSGSRRVEKSEGSDEWSDDDDTTRSQSGEVGSQEESQQKKKRTMVRRWKQQKHYFLELSFLTWMFIALFVYFTGKTTNTMLLQAWLTHFMPLLKKNFSLIGDDGNMNKNAEKNGEPTVVRDNASNFQLFCSGRRNSMACLFEFEMCSRQDLNSVLYSMLFKTRDEMVMTFELSNSDMRNKFAFALVPAATSKEYKETHNDLRTCTASKGSGFRGLPKTHTLFCDSEAAAMDVLSAPVRTALNENASLFHSLHVTDMNPFENVRSKQVLRMRVYLPHEKEMAKLETLMLMIMHMVDRINQLRLSDKDTKTCEQLRETAKSEQTRLINQQKQEDAIKKKIEQRKLEKQKRDEWLESLPADQQKKIENKRLRQDKKKKNSSAKMAVRLS